MGNDGIIIDMSSPQEQQDNNELVIDMTSGNVPLSYDEDIDINDGSLVIGNVDTPKDTVDLSTISNRNNKTVILPKDKSGNNSTKAKPMKTKSSKRKAVDISEIPTEEPGEDPSIHNSPIEDILSLDNPDSIFSKYVEKEKKEAEEWMAEKKDEAETLAAEKADEEQLMKDESEEDNRPTARHIETMNESSSLVADFESKDYSGIKYNTVELEGIDELAETNDNGEENNMSDINKNDDVIIEYDDPESEIPVDDEEYEDEIIESDDVELEDNDVEVEPQEEPAEEVSESSDDDIEDKDENIEESVAAMIESDEDDSEKEESKEVKKDASSEPERYDAPDDMDAEIEDKKEKFAVEIEEEDEAAAIEDNQDTDAILKNLQRMATEKLKPVSKSLDISSFTILKKPTVNVSSAFEAQSAKVAKWVLPNQESIVLMKEFSGAELEKLREYSENNRSLDSLNRRFHLIYDHIVSPKPATFEQWLKTTPYEDVDNYFFAIYVASFKGANYLPADCINPECNETFLSDDIKIMDMVKFTTKKGQKKFAELYQSEATPAGKGIYCTEVVPLNNKIAVAFREPSIYNVFEIAGLDDRTRTNYASIIEYIPYIDKIYLINEEEQTLTQVTYKMYADNANRTVRSKIQKYDNILNLLSVDEFGTVKAYATALSEKVQDMYYVLPAISCPKCGNSTNEARTTAEELVFTRYQLGSLVTTSLN